LPEDTYEGIPRRKIPWDPKIDTAKCTTCGKCVEFCHMQTFEIKTVNAEKQTIIRPNRCVVFCHGCDDICPAGAISHPDEEQTQKTIDELKRA
jgi:formate hydrogenlyase subunit 6/NADH:ubiquinone oxidoreductase subunit I